jgi:hypothetical protein
MKARGLLVVLVLAVAIVYLIWFSKSGDKTHLEQQVDRFEQSREELTRVNMQTLQKIIESYIASEGQTPKNLQELRTANLLMGNILDSWGKPFKYERLSDSSFRLVSAGKDKVFDTQDDIVMEY